MWNGLVVDRLRGHEKAPACLRRHPEHDRKVSSDMTSVAESIAIEQMRKHPGLLEWFHFGEVGVSSEFIARYLTGQNTRGGFNDPADPDDFKRCEKLLRAAPSLRKEFQRMAEVSTRWGFLVENWDAITASLENEIPGIFGRGHTHGSAPKTYALMNADRA